MAASGSKAAHELGLGWKACACINIKAGEEREIANIAGPGAIQQIWMTPTGNWRYTILRIYWDDADAAERRMSGRRFLRLRLGQVFAAGQLAGGVRESRAARSTATGHAVSQTLPDHDDEYRREGR